MTERLTTPQPFRFWVLWDGDRTHTDISEGAPTPDDIILCGSSYMAINARDAAQQHAESHEDMNPDEDWRYWTFPSPANLSDRRSFAAGITMKEITTPPPGQDDDE